MPLPCMPGQLPREQEQCSAAGNVSHASRRCGECRRSEKARPEIPKMKGMGRPGSRGRSGSRCPGAPRQAREAGSGVRLTKNWNCHCHCHSSSLSPTWVLCCAQSPGPGATARLQSGRVLASSLAERPEGRPGLAWLAGIGLGGHLPRAPLLVNLTQTLVKRLARLGRSWSCWPKFPG
jgi:hypothetical protein